jgi:hypothetical protein
MDDKNHQINKNKYDMARHHAWAGSVLLAVILALRLFISPANEFINTISYVLIVCVIFYILISLGLTYKYRSAIIGSFNRSNPDNLINNAMRKDQVKLQKKQGKNTYKIRKKQQYWWS